MNRTGRVLLFIVALAALAGGLAAAVLWRPGAAEVPQIDGFVYPQPKTISPFRLTAHDGSPFERDDLEGKWTFVFFGYTHCPDICPLTLAELHGVERLLDEADVPAQAQYLFVSVDPKRDTPERLAQYVHHFSPAFIGATGRDPVLRQLTRELGVLYEFPDGTEGDNYEVAHSASIELFDPQARLHAVFTAPHQAQTIADDFRKIYRHWQRQQS